VISRREEKRGESDRIESNRMSRSNEDRYNQPVDENEKLKSVQRKADQVTDIARQNISLSIAQVDRLQDLEEKSENLQNASTDFHKGAKAVKWKMCRKSWTMLGLILCAVAIIIIIIAVSVAKK